MPDQDHYVQLLNLKSYKQNRVPNSFPHGINQIPQETQTHKCKNKEVEETLRKPRHSEAHDNQHSIWLYMSHNKEKELKISYSNCCYLATVSPLCQKGQDKGLHRQHKQG